MSGLGLRAKGQLELLDIPAIILREIQSKLLSDGDETDLLETQ